MEEGGAGSGVSNGSDNRLLWTADASGGPAPMQKCNGQYLRKQGPLTGARGGSDCRWVGRVRCRRRIHLMGYLRHLMGGIVLAILFT
jgi:hypothetical protein